MTNNGSLLVSIILQIFTPLAQSEKPLSKALWLVIPTKEGPVNCAWKNCYNQLYCLRQPVSPPDGAAITGITVYVFDNDVTCHVYASLYHTNATASALNVVTTGVTSGAPGYAMLTATTNSVMYNSNYSYYIRFVTAANGTHLRIHGPGSPIPCPRRIDRVLGGITQNTAFT